MNYEVVSLVLATSAAARSFAPDVWFLVRRLLGAGVRIGATALSEQQTQPPAATPASWNEGGHR
ncbi:hypothetical protein QQY66_39800 [Streptomyces sp. DG2A-72]|uniref:hypothetical protein n=1 Tax=Streptomyces sp. DG2A-72 TaxID=3051386 RepID=UPI00265BE1B3|nr:hypothetical protein [Streptomyces sp. DG2A-72]MDO0937573.1 hypothetical protein [Streptomyces sp. DG2A-72]